MCGVSTLHFYLGTHQPHWLWHPDADFPLFVSHRALSRYAKLQPSTSDWALDSGGFTELSTYGEWRTTAAEYVRATARYDREAGYGTLGWAAPQDWMCEPFILALTGLSVAEHQRRTVASFLELRDLWPGESDQGCPFMPVLQGWEPADYHRCWQMYAAAGVELRDYPVVGLGSVCRRQGTREIADLIGSLTPALALHGFGVKSGGLGAAGHELTSADSLAWSFSARRQAPMAGHPHKNCANCLPYAAAWRDRLLAGLDTEGDRGCGCHAGVPGCHGCHAGAPPMEAAA
jgi:hypothetical protein